MSQDGALLWAWVIGEQYQNRGSIDVTGFNKYPEFFFLLIHSLCCESEQREREKMSGGVDCTTTGCCLPMVFFSVKYE